MSEFCTPYWDFSIDSGGGENVAANLMTTGTGVYEYYISFHGHGTAQVQVPTQEGFDFQEGDELTVVLPDGSEVILIASNNGGGDKGITTFELFDTEQLLSPDDEGTLTNNTSISRNETAMECVANCSAPDHGGFVIGPENTLIPVSEAPRYTYTHFQETAESSWQIIHKLGYETVYPVLKSDNGLDLYTSGIVQKVLWLNQDTIEIVFKMPMTGTAYVQTYFGDIEKK